MSVKGNGVKVTVRRNHVTSGGDREEEEGLGRADHPLLNDLILKTLFGFVERSDLEECRVVSRKWNLHSIPNMRANFKVTIPGSQSNSETCHIQDFVELFSSNTLGIPFATFHLGPFLLTGEVGQQFLQICGETAKEIDLHEVEESDVYTIEDVSELLRSSPNLQVFRLPYRLISRSGNIVKLFPNSTPTFSSLKQIYFRPDIEKGLLKFCPSFIEELMTAALNISDIVVEDDEKEDDDDDTGRNVILVLNCIEKLGRESSIQSLNLDPATLKDIEHLERMAKNGLKLKSLTIRPFSFEGDLGDVHIRLATSFKDSLEYLNMGQSFETISMEFPNMPRLKSLTQRIKHGFNSTALNLNENLPALETLEIGFERRNEEDLDQFFRTLQSCPTLKSLVVENAAMTIFGFHNVLRVFPNLTKLNLRIGADGVEVLRQVWSQMTELESLSISGYIERREKEYLDSLFLGIPTHVLKEITPVVNDLEDMTVQNRRQTIERLQNDHSELPSLRNLTKLRHLGLNVSGGKNCQYLISEREIHLTDLTGYLALYTMSHLKHLKFDQCCITRTCCEMLRKETGLEILYH